MVSNWRRDRRANNGCTNIMRNPREVWIELWNRRDNDDDPSLDGLIQTLKGVGQWGSTSKYEFIYTKIVFLVQSIIITFLFTYVNLEGSKAFIMKIILSWNYKKIVLSH